MSGTSPGERAVQLALRCYPRWWRDRYGPDQEALVEDLRADESGRAWLASGAWGLTGSFLAGAARAHFSGFGMPAVSELWQRRARTAIIAASLPAIVAVGVAWLLWGRTTEYGRGGSGPGPVQLSAAGQVIHWESLLMALLSLVFLIELASGAVVLSREMRALAPPRRRLLVAALSLAPVAVIGLGLLLLIEAARLRPVISGSEWTGQHVIHVWYSYPGHPLAATILFIAGWIGILGGWVGGAVVLATMAARRRFPVHTLLAGARRTRTMALLQGSVALCALAQAIVLPLQPPIGPGGGMIYRSDLGHWAPVLSALLVAGALMTWAAARAAKHAVTRAAALA